MTTKRAPNKIRKFLVLYPSSLDVVGAKSEDDFSAIEGTSYKGEEALKRALAAGMDEDPTARVYELTELKYTIDVKIEKA